MFILFFYINMFNYYFFNVKICLIALIDCGNGLFYMCVCNINFYLFDEQKSKSEKYFTKLFEQVI